MEQIRYIISHRGLAWSSFYSLIVIAWALVLLHGVNLSTLYNPAALTFNNSFICRGAAVQNLPGLILMWGLMSAAMMAPALIPTLNVYQQLNHCGAASISGFFGLVIGYLGVWLGFAVLGAYVQQTLAGLHLLDGAGASLSPWLSAGLLLAAGGFQFSQLKHACLNKCQHPLSFFISNWRPGPMAALQMGLRLGIVCVGCCWALMALGFVGGTMNLLWMAAATFFMSAEKLPEFGRSLSKPVGYGLIAAGCYIIITLIF